MIPTHVSSLSSSPPSSSPPSLFSLSKPPLSKIHTHPASILLNHCSSTKRVHQVIPLIYKHGLYDVNFIQTKLVSLFCRFNCLEDAARVFDPIEDKIDVLYHTMLKGYAQSSSVDDAFAFFCRMKSDGVQPLVHNFTYLLKLCGDNWDLRRGREIQGQLIVHGFGSNSFATNAIVSMYAKCRQVGDAHKMFDRMVERDVVSWTAIISGYAQNGYAETALEFLMRMQEEGRRPNYITVITALPACADMGSLNMGKSIHGYVIRSGFDSYVNVLTALVDMYGKCGAVDTARLVFDAIDSKTVVSWNCLIDGYVQSGDPEEALALFQKMLDEGFEPSDVSIIEVLNACSDLGDVERGMSIHKLSDELGLGSNVSVMNSLISMYTKCDRVDVASKLFNDLEYKTRESWNAMIEGFVRNNQVNEALDYFCRMRQEGIKLNSFTLLSIIPALAELSILQQAKWIHGIAIRTCLDQDVDVMTALIDMYANCGATQTAGHLLVTYPWPTSD